MSRLFGGWVVSAAVVLGAVAGAAGAATPEPIAIPGGENRDGRDYLTLDSVSCASATECLATGSTDDNPAVAGDLFGATVRISDGKIGPVVQHQSFSNLLVEDCGSATVCVGRGNPAEDPYGTKHGLLWFTNGKPGSLSPIPRPPRVAPRDISCWSARDCVMVGERGDPDPFDSQNNAAGFTWAIRDGVVQDPVMVADIEGLAAVSCPTSTCMAVGRLKSSATGALVPITNGTPGAAKGVTGTSRLMAIDCAAAGACEAGGQRGEYEQGTALTFPVVNGVAGTPSETAGPPSIGHMVCRTASDCKGLGLARTSAGRAGGTFVVPIRDGVAGAPTNPRGYYTWDAACAGSAGCVAVGRTAEGAALLPLGLDIKVPPAVAELTNAPTVTGATVKVPLACEGATTCKVTGKLTTDSKPVGARTTTLKPDGTATLKITLNDAGKKLLAKPGKLPVTLKVTQKADGETTTVAKRKLKM
jgi:hypothetical protein